MLLWRLELLENTTSAREMATGGASPSDVGHFLRPIFFPFIFFIFCALVEGKKKGSFWWVILLAFSSLFLGGNQI